MIGSFWKIRGPTDDGRPRVGWGTLTAYGVGAISSGIKMRALSGFLLLFYNQVVGLPPTTVALAVTIITVFDAIVNPLVGYLSDKHRSKLGRRHPFMLISAIPFALFFFLLWTPPVWLETDGLFVYLLVCLMALRLFDTFFELPMISLAPELIQDYDRRNLIVSSRIFFRTIAGILFTVAALQFILAPDRGGATSADGYLLFAAIGAFFIFVSIMVCTLATMRFIPWLREPDTRKISARRMAGDVFNLLKVKAARVMIAAGMVVAISSAARGGLELYFGLYFWQLTQTQLSLLVTLTGVATLFGAILVSPVARRMGKKRAAILMLVLAILAGNLPIVLRLADLFPSNGTQALFVILAIDFFVQGVSFMMVAVLMNSMLNDVVEEVEVQSGRRTEGLLFAADGFFSQAISGLGVMISGLLLTIIGFPRDADPQTISPAVMSELGLIFTCIMVTLGLAILALFIRFPIDRKRHLHNLETLDRRQLEERKGQYGTGNEA